MKQPVLRMLSGLKAKAKTAAMVIMKMVEIEIVEMEMVDIEMVEMEMMEMEMAEMEIQMRIIGMLGMLFESVHTKTSEVSTTQLQGNGRSYRFDKRTVRTDVAFAMSWKELIKLMAEVYSPRNEIQKMESEQ
nr:hypothetical protein [Tanacetum cinerariifolium]